VTGTWRLLVDDGADAAGGLALDEALMASYHRGQPQHPPTLRCYTYADHCALVGRYQHLAAEVDLDACERLGVAVNRRPTGGGAIIMGSGQLGIAVTAPAPVADRPRDLLERCSAGIVAGLAEIGLEATFRGKNDLQVGGRKSAGLGLYLDDAGGLLFHASVLADLDIPLMLQVLNVPAARLGDRAVAAVRERITTVTAETGEPWDGPRLRNVIVRGFTRALGVEPEPDVPTPAELDRAQTLRCQRYDDAGWWALRTPQPDATATAVLRTPSGLLRAYLALRGEVIKSVLFTGDVNVLPPEIPKLEAALTWHRLDPVTLEATVAEFCRTNPIPDLAAADIWSALLDAGRRAVAGAGRAEPSRQGSCYFPEER
jgi:lipoate-protein ligase A